MNDKPTYIPNTYGRRIDKPLRVRSAELMKTVLPKISMPDPTTDQIDLQNIFPESKEVWLEVGFGGGEHLAWQSNQNPNIGMIGAEPFINGVAKLVTQIDEQKLENIRIHFGDARVLMEALPDHSLNRLFVLHPDPWPKARHHKRRMISPWFFAEAERLIRPGGTLRVASDIPDYIRWTLMHSQSAVGFEWTAECADDWKVCPDDWPQTRYEAKAYREGRIPTYLSFIRI